MEGRGTISVLGVLFLCTVAQTSYMEADVLATPTTCTQDSDCPSTHTLCEKVNVTVGSAAVEQDRCVCDESYNFHKVGTVCKYRAQLGERCSAAEAVCVSTSTECREDGDNMDSRRCLCQPGYARVTIGGDDKCARVIHKRIDSACVTCESNGGKCFDFDQDGSKDGCKCPTFTSGTDCVNSHANVVCDISTFTMRVCYSPQTGFDFSAGGRMLVDSRGTDEACKGVPAITGDPNCSPGSYVLELPLDDPDRGRCDTRMYKPEVNQIKYATKILIQKSYSHFDDGDIVFTATCSFSTQANTLFDPVGLLIVNEFDSGEHHDPQIAMTVENHLGQPIGEGVTLRLRDKIRLKLVLTQDGTYAAMRVLRCMASNKATPNDARAISTPLLLKSCPAQNQDHITEKNNWRPISGQRSQLRTGLVRMFKLPEGRSVHIHCAVKVCLQGAVTECDPVNCANPASHFGYGRKRRSVDSRPQETVVSRRLVWFEGKRPMLHDKPKLSTKREDSGSFVLPVVAAAMGGALPTFVFAVIVLLLKLRRSAPRPRPTRI